MDASIEASKWIATTTVGGRKSHDKRHGPRPLALHIAEAEWAWRARSPSKLKNFYRGIKAYRSHPYRRIERMRHVVWEAGESRLYDYGPEDGWPILIVPSLINRAYILDLMPGMSLLNELRTSGFRPYLLDWGQQTNSDRRLSLDSWIIERLEPAFDWVCRTITLRPFVLGYCMGGTLSTALACLRPGHMAGLALLAAPWDFSNQDVTHQETTPHYHALASVAGGLGSISVDFLQMLFAQLDPLLIPRKFLHFAQSDLTSEKATLFVAIEDWLNDGAPLGAEVAAECFLDWYGNNAPARGLWRVNGEPIKPERLDLPICLAVPENDHIVPPRSALALTGLLKNYNVIRPKSGHIGMVAGQQGRDVLWKPLAAWLRRCRRIGP